MNRTDLNTYSEVVFDVLMSVTGKDIPSGQIVVKEELYPGQIVIINNSGAIIGYNVFSSDSEFTEYQNQPEYFNFIPMESGEVVSSDSTVRIKKVVFKKQSGTATFDMNVRCINYRQIP